MTAREGLASSSGSGRSDASRGAEGRREGGRPGGGRAEGGARSPGGGCEGQRGREVGSVGGGGGGRGAEAGAGEGAPGGVRGRRSAGVRGSRRPPACAPSPAPRRSPLTPPRLPSPLGRGREPQTLRHSSRAGAGGEATAKLSANFAAWRDVGCEARLVRGGGARLTQAATPGPLTPPLSRLLRRPLSPTSIRYLRARDDPSLDLVGKGRSREPGHPEEDWGRGDGAPVPCAERQHLHVFR